MKLKLLTFNLLLSTTIFAAEPLTKGEETSSVLEETKQQIRNSSFFVKYVFMGVVSNGVDEPYPSPRDKIKTAPTRERTLRECECSPGKKVYFVEKPKEEPNSPTDKGLTATFTQSDMQEFVKCRAEEAKALNDGDTLRNLDENVENFGKSFYGKVPDLRKFDTRDAASPDLYSSADVSEAEV